MSDLIEIREARPGEERRLSFGAFLATEGGRKCPQCGRYAKQEELGYVGGKCLTQDGGVAIVTAYGHLPGFGCNKAP